jgi:hypothetical protein
MIGSICSTGAAPPGWQLLSPPHLRPVVQGCGLVVESHIIDERSEWRTFSDKVRTPPPRALDCLTPPLPPHTPPPLPLGPPSQDKESADPNRVGGPVNHLLGDGGMGTTIARVANDGGLSFNLARTQARTNTRDRPIQEAQRQISDICNRWGVRLPMPRALWRAPAAGLAPCHCHCQPAAPMRAPAGPGARPRPHPPAPPLGPRPSAGWAWARAPSRA